MPSIPIGGTRPDPRPRAPLPTAKPMPSRVPAGPRKPPVKNPGGTAFQGPKGAFHQIDEAAFAAIPQNQREAARQTFKLGGIGGFKDKYGNTPWGGQIANAITGSAQNPPGQRPADGVATPVVLPQDTNPQPIGGGGISVGPIGATGPMGEGGVPQGATPFDRPTASGFAEDPTKKPEITQTPDIMPAPGQPPITNTPPINPVPSGVPQGGITKNWRPNDPAWIAETDKRLGAGTVQRAQQEMTAATASLPQGQRQAAIYAILQKYGMVPGGAPAPVPGPAPTTGQDDGTTYTPPINPLPPVAAQQNSGPIYAPPVLTGAEPVPATQPVPDIFGTYF